MLSKLQKGDIVDLIAPASAFSAEDYNAAIKFVEDLGLAVRIRSYDELVNQESLYSNSDEYRFESLVDALLSPSRAIWCICGGYGSYKLLERLDKQFGSAPKVGGGVSKLFIGFSDITVLLNYLIDKLGWSVIHGVMPTQITRGSIFESSKNSVIDLMFGRVGKVEIPTVFALNNSAKQQKETSGIFIGGCLSLMQVLLGTEQDVDFSGKIILLEDDRFETPERVDRIFDHMLRAGKFKGAAGVILGNFLELPEGEVLKHPKMGGIFERFGAELDKLSVPLLHSPYLGHGKNALSIPLGMKTTLSLGSKPQIRINLLENE